MRTNSWRRPACAPSPWNDTKISETFPATARMAGGPLARATHRHHQIGDVGARRPGAQEIARGGEQRMAVGGGEGAFRIVARRARPRDGAAVDARTRGVGRAVDAVGARGEEDRSLFAGEREGGRERQLLAPAAAAARLYAHRGLAAGDERHGPVSGCGAEAPRERAPRGGRIAAER